MHGDEEGGVEGEGLFHQAVFEVFEVGNIGDFALFEQAIGDFGGGKVVVGLPLSLFQFFANFDALHKVAGFGFDVALFVFGVVIIGHGSIIGYYSYFVNTQRVAFWCG